MHVDSAGVYFQIILKMIACPMRIIKALPRLALILGFILPVTAMAQSQTLDIRDKAERLKGDALLEAFMGKTFDGAYNFTDQGKPRRFFTETHFDDSRAVYTEDGKDTKGIWTIMQNNICYRYKSSNMSGGCFRVYKISNCFYFYDQRIEERPREIGENYWTARSTRQGETADCEASFT